ncbi:MAG TPA: hypothetical protein VEG44_02220 [Candidatus Acidoferrales bacterium]|nr:hypothetical protein [Candidatus Acidoferrales bacterium]
MITKESIVLTRWIKKVGVDEFGFFDSKENPCHIIDYVDVHSAPNLDKVLPLCTQVFIESSTSGKAYTYYRPTSMAIEYLLKCNDEIEQEKKKIEKIEHNVREIKRDRKSGRIYRMRKTAKWIRTNVLLSILVLVSIFAIMDVALKS